MHVHGWPKGPGGSLNNQRPFILFLPFRLLLPLHPLQLASFKTPTLAYFPSQHII